MMTISERLMRIIEECDRMTEEEIVQEYALAETDIVEQLEDLTRAVRILQAMRKGDAQTLVAVKYGML